MFLKCPKCGIRRTCNRPLDRRRWSGRSGHLRRVRRSSVRRHRTVAAVLGRRGLRAQRPDTPLRRGPWPRPGWRRTTLGGSGNSRTSTEGWTRWCLCRWRTGSGVAPGPRIAPGSARKLMDLGEIFKRIIEIINFKIVLCSDVYENFMLCRKG